MDMILLLLLLLFSLPFSGNPQFIPPTSPAAIPKPD